MNRNRRILASVLLAALLLAACGSRPAAHADLSAVYDSISDSLALPEMLVLPARRVQSYYGLDPESCPQLLIAVCDEGLRVDEIWLIEAADEKAAEAILATARSRIEQICTETENYLPDQYAVAKAAQALRIGNSVGLFVSPDAKAMADLFTKAFH